MLTWRQAESKQSEFSVLPSQDKTWEHRGSWGHLWELKPPVPHNAAVSTSTHHFVCLGQPFVSHLSCHLDNVLRFFACISISNVLEALFASPGSSECSGALCHVCVTAVINIKRLDNRFYIRTIKQYIHVGLNSAWVQQYLIIWRFELCLFAFLMVRGLVPAKLTLA